MTRIPPAIRALAVALVLFTLCVSRGFTGLERVREKLVERPIEPAGNTVSVQTDRLDRLAAIGQPLAVVARIEAEADVMVTIEVDGRPVCTRPAGRGDRRLDCVTGPLDPHAGVHRVNITAPGGPWRLDSLEIATHHGNTTGLFYFVVIPQLSRAYTSVGWPASAVLAVLFGLAAALLPAWPLGRVAFGVYRVLAGLALLLTVVVVASPWVTSFRVVLSLGTCIALASLVLAPQLASALWWLTRVIPRPTLGVVVVRALAVALCAVLPFWMLVSSRLDRWYGGNYSGFLQISERDFEANPLFADRPDVRAQVLRQPGGGYDGQFNYYIAFDPLMRTFAGDPAQYRAVVDAVPYRFGRIGLAWAAVGLSAGRWPLYPRTMSWLLLAAIGCLAFTVAAAAQTEAWSPALGLLTVVVPGFWRSVQTTLPEPLAAALLVLGIVAALRRSWRAAAFCCALSLLVRETGVIAVGGLFLLAYRRDGSRQAATFLALAALPVVLWRVYVGAVIFPDWGLRGFLDHPADLTVPFTGFVHMWRAIADGTYMVGTKATTIAGVLYPALLIMALGLSLASAWLSPGPIGIAALGYSLIGVSLNYPMIWVDLGNGQRGTYEVFVLLLLATLYARPHRALTRAFAIFWAAACLYVFWGTFEAESVLGGLGLI